MSSEPVAEETHYQAPKQVSMDELLAKDQDDASLNKYKQALIGEKVEPVFPNDPRKVISDSFTIVFINDQSKNIEFNPEKKDQKFHYDIAEGTAFQLKIRYFVQHDIVVGLRFVNTVHKLLVKVDEINENIGSYAPKAERYEFISREDETPSGFLARGNYKGNARLIDADGNVYVNIDYTFTITK